MSSGMKFLQEDKVAVYSLHTALAIAVPSVIKPQEYSTFLAKKKKLRTLFLDLSKAVCGSPNYKLRRKPGNLRIFC
jgi:hypothetical protein